MKSVQNQAMIMEKSAKKHDKCEIKWNTLSLCEWESAFRAIKKSNLLQSYDYTCVMARLNNQRVRRGLIVINGEAVGLVQILEAGIFKNAVHGVILDRGPLWFDEYGGMSDFELFLRAFSEEFPKRFGRRMRFIPEMKNTNKAQSLLEKHGYKPTSKHSYQTIYLDLRPDLEVLRSKLNKKWRNMLVKAEKQGLNIVFSDKGEHFSWLLQHYAADKALRKYDGAKPKVIMELAKEFSRGENMLIGTALLDDKPIAAILIFNHGISATYQIGYTSDIGRNKNAHHLLLWNAVVELKERNINDFDLGGINGDSAKGVKLFKEGLGGTIYETLGLYN